MGVAELVMALPGWLDAGRSIGRLAGDLPRNLVFARLAG
jgi:hypothetical protein